MGNSKQHFVLSSGEDFESAQNYVLSFFENTMLLHYDKVTILKEKSYKATQSLFWEELEKGVAANKDILAGFIKELQESGLNDIADLPDTKHGYQSKVFHIIAHLLDGFIGIDSVFYSLPEDSHWLSEKLRQAILIAPESYWLFAVEAQFDSADTASVVHL